MSKQFYPTLQDTESDSAHNWADYLYTFTDEKRDQPERVEIVGMAPPGDMTLSSIKEAMDQLSKLGFVAGSFASKSSTAGVLELTPHAKTRVSIFDAYDAIRSSAFKHANIHSSRVRFYPFLKPATPRFVENIPIPFAENMELALQEASNMLEWPEGWDGENANKITPGMWNAARLFLLSYSHYIRRHYDREISVPEINPCPDGTIDFSWRTTQARMLVNIRKDSGSGDFKAYYYGDNNNNQSPIKGNVPLDAISEYLAVWMKFLV